MTAKKSKSNGDQDAREQRTGHDYDLTTPLWSRYYQQVRRSIRFPRYYKKALNW